MAAFALEPLVRRVVVLELTREMLEVARRITAERGISTVDWVIGDACVLPFADETFDVYVVRAAPHHFPRFDEFLREAFRVLRPGRDAAFIDCAPPLPARDVLHEAEKRPDPSPGMSYTVDEWTDRLQAAGFEVETARARELDWDYDEWMRTMGVQPELAGELATVIESAKGEARGHPHPEPRGGKPRPADWPRPIPAPKPD